MSRITRCKDTKRRAKAVPATMVARILFVFAVGLGLCLAHIHLRVSLYNTNREISSLQSEQSRLVSQIKSLRGENESMKNPKALQSYARNELGMVSYNPSTRMAIAMPEEIQARYALARASAGATIVAAAPQSEPAWIQSVGETIGMVGVNDAVAQDER